MTMADHIIHIGYPKTATTFLQRSVFPAISEINYIDYHQSVDLLSPLIYLDDLDYSMKEVKEKLAPFFNDSLTLMSFEGLCGAPFIYKGLARSAIAKRLKELGFNKVIITLRDQVSLIDSIYRQHILQGGVVRFKDFVDIDGKFNLYNRSFNLEYLNYFKLIKHYQEIFGVQNVIVLSHQELVADQQLYVKKLLHFINPDSPEFEISTKSENSALSNLAINLLRIVNHFIFTSQKPNHLIWNKISTKYVSKAFQAILNPYLFRFFSSKKSYVKSRERDFLKQYYAQSNAQLIELLGNDFSL
jgi:hypothetical protein